MFSLSGFLVACSSVLLSWRVGQTMQNLQRLFRTNSQPEAEKLALPGSESTSLPPREKLKAYRDLAEETLERAYQADQAGDFGKAKPRYQMALNVIEEGLQIPAPESGLGPAYCNVAKWKSDMQVWQPLVQLRLQVLASPRAAHLAPPPATRITRTPQSAILRASSLNRPAQHASRAPAASSRAPAAKQKSAAADSKFREVILAEVLDTRPSVGWDDIAGLANAKQALQEMVILPALRADLFRGLRSPARGLLLYGPPGNGKTMLAKALAHEAKATFFNISASSLTSKWHGEAEKLVRALFAVAAEMQPAIIFIDEIDSILSERSAGEHEASRRLKTQFLVEFDGVANASDRVVVIGATNRPQELDDAVRRRLVKRIYIPMPDEDARHALLKHTLQGQPNKLRAADFARLVAATEGYSASDLAALCREAAMQPLRELGPAISTVPAERVRALQLRDFQAALASIRPSVSLDQLHAYEAWTASFGTHS